MSKLAKALSAAAGNAGDANLYPEDVFSTYLYEGTGSAININNGLDLSGEGGLTWLKSRSLSEVNILMDTVRGVQSALVSNNFNNVFTLTGGVTAFNSNGFTLGTSNIINTNNSTNTSWSFRKAAGFFDIVTFTGNDTPRTIAHNLGSVPKMIIVKSISDDYDWVVYHASLTNQQNLTLDSSNPAGNSGAEYWNSTTPTSSVFSLGTQFRVNGNNKTYVAYLFGDDAIFGDDGDEQICKIGSYTGNGTVGRTVDFGFEPQWVLIKPNANDDWYLFDTMREWTTDISERLRPNTNDEAGRGFYYIPPNATGITFNASSGGALNANGTEYIYMAIRRPMKVPEAGTAVFNIGTYGANRNNSSTSTYYAGFPVDMAIKKVPVTAVANNFASTRMLGTTDLKTNSTAAERTGETEETFDSNTHWNSAAGTSSTSYSWMFKRAPKFMDVVAYTGTNGTISRNHNLTVAPELMIFKRRNSTSAWTVLSELAGSSYSEMALDSTIDKSTRNYSANQYLTAQPTATVFAQAAGYDNVSGGTYITYLFATLAGISKVGSYTGNAGYAVNVDCGFSNGARFILIKRTNASGDWYVYDSVRGIVAGNDPYFFLNNTAAQVTNTDYIDPLASGFTVTSSAPAGLNASGVTYLFLAIA